MSFVLNFCAALAAAVKQWQKLKDQGKLVEPAEEEEDIYAEARIGEVRTL